MKPSSLLGVVVVVLAVVCGASAEESPIEDPEFQKVTCGSSVKLVHQESGFRLHSHEIPYGSGSGQQSVTAFPNGNDPNSYWVVKSAFGESCSRGQVIACGSTVRLMHLNTKKNLHSHHHRAPMSGNQEVSAYERTDAGDNWRVDCPKGAKFWERERPVRLFHMETRAYLVSNKNRRYNNPIPGQLEVSATGSDSNDAIWLAQEGIYFGDRTFK